MAHLAKQDDKVKQGDAKRVYQDHEPSVEELETVGRTFATDGEVCVQEYLATAQLGAHEEAEEDERRRREDEEGDHDDPGQRIALGQVAAELLPARDRQQ